jgi:UDP-2,3-diacylglucosamine pyrophosphatase LpxH
LLTHQDILAALQEGFAPAAPRHAGGVFLVARLHDPALELDPTPHVFVGDWHLTPAADARRFGTFVFAPAQHEAMARLIGCLTALRAGGTGLGLWQLGDLFDLWRTGSPATPVAQRVAAIEADHGASLLDPLRALRPTILCGNHDRDLETLDGYRHAHLPIVVPGVGGGADVLLMHGDDLDPIERFPRWIKEKFVRRRVEEAPTPERCGYLHYDLGHDVPVPLGRASVNVRAAVGVGGFFFRRALARARTLRDEGRDVRLVVIGHSHQPRIICEPNGGGRPFVLMDIGAWLTPSLLSRAMSQAPILNAQVGVKVGSDLRIYQLGCIPAI